MNIVNYNDKKWHFKEMFKRLYAEKYEKKLKKIDVTA